MGLRGLRRRSLVLAPHARAPADEAALPLDHFLDGPEDDDDREGFEDQEEAAFELRAVLAEEARRELREVVLLVHVPHLQAVEKSERAEDAAPEKVAGLARRRCPGHEV